MATNRIWKREYDRMIHQACRGKACKTLYGASVLEITDVVDESGEKIPSYDQLEGECLTALAGAVKHGLIQAWSIAQTPAAYTCMVVRFDGQAARNASADLADAACWLLLEISARRN